MLRGYRPLLCIISLARSHLSRWSLALLRRLLLSLNSRNSLQEYSVIVVFRLGTTVSLPLAILKRKSAIFATHARFFEFQPLSSTRKTLASSLSAVLDVIYYNFDNFFVRSRLQRPLFLLTYSLLPVLCFLFSTGKENLRTCSHPLKSVLFPVTGRRIEIKAISGAHRLFFCTCVLSRNRSFVMNS